MLAFLTAPQNTPFAVVLALILVLFVVEVIGLLFGASIGSLIGGDTGAGVDVDVDVDALSGAEGFSPGVVTSFLYWVNVGRVPFIILMVLFMTAFVLAGYILQYFCLTLVDHMLPSWLASLVAVALSIPCVRVLGKGLSRIMPRDETEAISTAELVGTRAAIVLGTARRGSPAQARASDRFGQQHYLMVEPDDPEAVLETGEPLLLVRREEGKFYAIKHPEP